MKLGGRFLDTWNHCSKHPSSKGRWFEEISLHWGMGNNWELRYGGKLAAVVNSNFLQHATQENIKGHLFTLSKRYIAQKSQLHIQIGGLIFYQRIIEIKPSLIWVLQYWNLWSGSNNSFLAAHKPGSVVWFLAVATKKQQHSTGSSKSQMLHHCQ